ncbi:MAG: hypothetical protein IPG89_15470 [Bacteroidetes bacterium]|nr:hypothetical protein [Bacteroidota bacterium]
MAIKPRNISFYSIKEWHNEPNGKVYPSTLTTIIEFIKKHTKINRKYNINVDKFCLIESASSHLEDGYYEIIVKAQNIAIGRLLLTGKLQQKEIILKLLMKEKLKKFISFLNLMKKKLLHLLKTINMVLI